MSSSKPHNDGVAEPVDTSWNPLQPAVEEIRLERFEFGKPCVKVDGNVVFKGNRPAEYQPLYQTSFFSQEQINWSQQQYRTGFSNKNALCIAHIPFIHKVGIESQWIALTQVHENRKELDTAARMYTMSRFAAQVASPSDPLPVGDVLSPYSVCRAVLREPMMGFPLNLELDPLYIKRNNIQTFLDWPEVTQAIRYTMMGIPICLLLRETSPGVFYPSLTEFSKFASALWHFLPLSIRPWFSWGWNVARSNTNQSLPTLLFFASTSPPSNVVVFDGHKWISKVPVGQIQRANRPRETAWDRILRHNHGDQSVIAETYGGYLQYNNISAENIPFAKLAHNQIQTLLLPSTSQSRRLTSISRQHLSPFLESIRSSLYGMEFSNTILNWLFSDTSEEFVFNIQHSDTELINMVMKEVMYPQWHTYTDVELQSPSFRRLLTLTWTFIEAIYKTFPTWRPTRILQKVPQSPDIQILLSLMILSSRPLQDQTIREIQGQLDQLISRQSTSMTQAFLKLFTKAALPASFRRAFFKRLDMFSWPYKELNGSQWEQHFSIFEQVYGLFPEWASSAEIRYNVLRFNLLYSSNKRFQWTQISSVDYVSELQDVPPTTEALSKRLPAEEFLAFLYYVTHIELKLAQPSPSSSNTVSVDSSRLTWCWDLVLNTPDPQLHMVLNLMERNQNELWLYLLKYGIQKTIQLSQNTEFINAVSQNDLNYIWTQFELPKRLENSWHCPTPSNSKAWIHIAEFCYSFFNTNLFLRCDPKWQTHILSLFPRLWPQLLTRSSEMGCTLSEHQSWRSPFDRPKGSVELEHSLNRLIENITNRSYPQEDVEALNQLLIQQIQKIKTLNNPSKNLRELHNFFLAIHESTKTTASVPKVNPNFYPLIKMLLHISPPLESRLGDVWKNLINRRPSNSTAVETTMLFTILCTYKPLRHPLKLTHIAHIVQRSDAKHKSLVQQSIDTIRLELQVSGYNTQSAESQEHVESTLEVLEKLIVKPQMFSIPSHWDSVFSQTMSALCFAKAPLKSLPRNHHTKWRKFFNLSEREMFHQEALFAKRYKKLPISASEFLYSYNNTFSPSSQLSSFGFTVPRRFLPTKQVSEPFQFLMSNWAELNGPQGYIPGTLNSLQKFEQFKRWMATVILTMVNSLAIFGVYLIHDSLGDIITKQNLPHYTPMVLFGIGIVCLIGLSMLVHSQLVLYCNRFRPLSFMVTSDKDSSRTSEAIEANIKRKKQRGNDSFYREIRVITIPNDIFNSLHLLATHITWTNLFNIKG